MLHNVLYRAEFSSHISSSFCSKRYERIVVLILKKAACLLSIQYCSKCWNWCC